MKRFKEYIAEGRDFPLYHGFRSDTYLIEALIEGKIYPSTIHRKVKLLKLTDKQEEDIDSSSHDYRAMLEATRDRGISTTRRYEFARRWSSDGFGGKRSAFVVAQLNHRMLTHNFQIIPIQYWSGKARSIGGENTHNEYEEFLITSKPLDLHRYMDKLILGQGIHQQIAESEAYYRRLIATNTNDRHFMKKMADTADKFAAFDDVIKSWGNKVEYRSSR